MTLKNVAGSNDKYILLIYDCNGLCVPGLKKISIFLLVTLGSQITLKAFSMF